MPRYVGIDYGEKRIGIAMSDEHGKFAFPQEVLQNNWPYLVKALKNYKEEQGVKVFVVGVPLSFSGKNTQQTEKVIAFCERLKKSLDVDIFFENETLSTKEIEKTKAAPQKMKDAAAAALILQRFLDRRVVQ